MGKFRRICVVCRQLNLDNHIIGEIDYEGPDEISGGMCDEHYDIALAKVIREHQRKSGHFPCYGTADGYCDQFLCKYRKKCLASDRLPSWMINQFLEEADSMSFSFAI